MWDQEGVILSSLTRPSTGKITPKNRTTMNHFVRSFQSSWEVPTLQAKLYQILEDSSADQSFRNLHKLSHAFISLELLHQEHCLLSPSRCSCGHHHSTEEKSQVLISSRVSHLRSKCSPFSHVKLCYIPQGVPLIPSRMNAHMWFQSAQLGST